MKSTYIKSLIAAILVLALSFTETDLIIESLSMDTSNSNTIRFWIFIAIVAFYDVLASQISINKNLEHNEN